MQSQIKNQSNAHLILRLSNQIQDQTFKWIKPKKASKWTKLRNGIYVT